MNKTKIILFLAELLAVAALRGIYMIRRDKVLPMGSKVGLVKGKPVFRYPVNDRFSRFKPPGQDKPENSEFQVGGWRPPLAHPKDNE